MPSLSLSGSHVLFHSIPTVTPESGYYYPHFMEDESEVHVFQKLAQGNPAAFWGLDIIAPGLQTQGIWISLSS